MPSCIRQEGVPAGTRRRPGLPLRLAGCFVSVLLATAFLGLAPEANLLWVANGLLLAYVLLAPRWRWPVYLATGFAAQLAGITLFYTHWRMNLLLAALNVGEVALSGTLLRRRTAELPDFARSRYILRFIAYAVVAAPAASGAIFAGVTAAMGNRSPWSALGVWTIADGLGTAVVAPACVAILRARLRNGADWKRDWIYPALLAAATVAGFGQTRFPLMFLVYPCLVLVLLRLGLRWAGACTLFVGVAGSWFSLHGMGPLTLQKPLSRPGSPVVIEIFVAAGMFTLYCIAVVLEDHRSSERRLEKIACLHSLMTENSRDAILICNFAGLTSYASPAMQAITGWTPAEVTQIGMSLMHPEDLPGVRKAVADLRKGEGSGRIEYRLRKRNGQYVWIEASLRIFLDPVTHRQAGILNVLRDISERKRTEQQLQAAYRAVEALAVVDGLTGLANRRRLDQSLATEWRRALREHKPISFLLIDADHFKDYNDSYGHVRGDSCLKQIAEAAQDVVARPGDLVARYGGEEFAVVLPDTERRGAAEIAHQICDALRQRRLTHSLNPSGMVTVSIGCATLIPHLGQPVHTLIEEADQALYRAKHDGRNRVCVAGEHGAGGVESDEKSDRYSPLPV